MQVLLKLYASVFPQCAHFTDIASVWLLFKYSKNTLQKNNNNNNKCVHIKILACENFMNLLRYYT